MEACIHYNLLGNKLDILKLLVFIIDYEFKL